MFLDFAFMVLPSCCVPNRLVEVALLKTAAFKNLLNIILISRKDIVRVLKAEGSPCFVPYLKESD